MVSSIATDGEVGRALAEYFRRGVDQRDWASWSELFTDDAVYVEHCLGRFEGRAAIGAWIAGATGPVRCMTFSIEWSMVDDGRAAFWIWNHLPDPDGEGVGYDFPNLAVVTYAGAGRWSAQEDFYNPREAGYAMTDWLEAGGTAEQPADPTLRAQAPSHPRPPVPAPDRAVMEAVCDAVLTENWLDLIATTGADWHDHGGTGIHQWAEGERVERFRLIDGARAVVVLDHRLGDHAVPAALVLHVNETGRVTYLDHVYNPAERVALSPRS